jgi:hypothetical protein
VSEKYFSMIVTAKLPERHICGRKRERGGDEKKEEKK